MLPHTEHRRHKRLNNRAGNSHLPTRKRERVLQRFKSAEHVQRFLGPFSAVCNHFRPRRHRLTASTYRPIRTERHVVWGRPEQTQAAGYLKALGSLLPTPPPGAPGPFALSEPEALASLAMTFGADGNLYISNHGFGPLGATGSTSLHHAASHPGSRSARIF